MKKLLLASFGMLACLTIGATQALADPDSEGAWGLTNPLISALITDDDAFATADLTVTLSSGGMYRTQHYGPYPSSSPDSGTCGNNWAEDTFDRHFTVRDNRDGTFTVVQQFKNGSFVTNFPTQPSPGSCDLDDGSPPGTVDPGITGGMHGYFIISNVVTQTSNSPYCDALLETNDDCTTATFINTHFTPCYPITCTVTTFAFNYAAGDQGLVEHTWKNASEDRGGNRGDIRSTNVP
jgi:hypothetical protein